MTFTDFLLIRIDYNFVRRGEKEKKNPLAQFLIRMFNTTFVGTGVPDCPSETGVPDCPSETGVPDCPQQKNFGRDVVFSADLYYNGVGDNNG